MSQLLLDEPVCLSCALLKTCRKATGPMVRDSAGCVKHKPASAPDVDARIQVVQVLGPWSITSVVNPQKKFGGSDMAEMEPRTARGALGIIARKLGVVSVAMSFKKTPQELVDLIGDGAGIPKAELQALMNDMDALKQIAAELGDGEAPAEVPAPTKKDPVRGRTAAAPKEEAPARGRGRAAAAEPEPEEGGDDAEESEPEEAPARGRGRTAAAEPPPKEPVRGRGRAAAAQPEPEPAAEAPARGGRGRGRAAAEEEAPAAAPKDPVRGPRGRGRAAVEEPAAEGGSEGGGSADLDAIYAKLDGLQTALDRVIEENKQLRDENGKLEARLVNIDKAAAFCVTELVFIDQKTGKAKEGAPATVSDIDDIEGYCYPG